MQLKAPVFVLGGSKNQFGLPTETGVQWPLHSVLTRCLSILFLCPQGDSSLCCQTSKKRFLKVLFYAVLYLLHALGFNSCIQSPIQFKLFPAAPILFLWYPGTHPSPLWQQWCSAAFPLACVLSCRHLTLLAG